MTIPLHITADYIVDNLAYLCAIPSTSGKLHELELMARSVADMVRFAGFDVRLVRTGGAPVIVGWRSGRNPYTLLLYHHYDVTPTGPWREWFHEPLQVAERDGYLYARGVAHGKGPLVAHLTAIRSLLDVEDELPHGLAIIVEGERLMGSPHLERVVTRYASSLPVNACLASGGERDINGIPLCYSGSKGLLQVRLSVAGSSMPLAPALSASVPNPAWRLAWAIGSIKGIDEDIRINGFYDSIEGPVRSDRAVMRHVQLDEAGRLEAWQIPHFLFGMSGASLVRTEVTLPTCNISSFHTEPSNGISVIPTIASARLDFQLVPQQTPDTILELLEKHLAERNLNDIMVEKLPGSYMPVKGVSDTVIIQRLVSATQTLYGTEPTVLPFGLFTLPHAYFSHYLNTHVATIAMSRHDSCEFGTNENIPIEDLVNHGQLLIELMLSVSECKKEVAQIQ